MEGISMPSAILPNPIPPNLTKSSSRYQKKAVNERSVQQNSFLVCCCHFMHFIVEKCLNLKQNAPKYFYFK